MKKYLKYILSFLIPFIIFNLFLIIEKITPYGNSSLLVSDLQAQYSVFLSYIRDFNNIFYSFNKGLGGAMYGTFAYYLSSPLNLIIYFFKQENLLTAISLIITLKISLSGLTMYTYLKNKLKKDDYLLLIFSTCYALMSYVVNYHFNIMWLDGVMWLPIVMLGIDRLINKDSSKIYLISLSVAIISNYYIGYMICIMSVLYFISQMFLEYDIKKDKQQIIKNFIISSLLAGMVSMIIIIPAFLELQNGYKMVENTLYIDLNFDVLNLISRSYLGAQNFENVLCVGEINIYCGLIILPLIYFYFINKHINKKEKIVYGFLLLILLSGFFVNLIDYIWHAFNTVTGFYYRYSFIICFLMILIAYNSLLKIEYICKTHYYIFILIYIFLSFFIVLGDYDYISNISIYYSLGLIILYLLLIYNLKVNKMCGVLLLILVFSELALNVYLSLDDYGYESELKYNKYVLEMKDSVIIEDNYRFEFNPANTRNDGLLLGYKGISSFVSTGNYNEMRFLLNAGYSGSSITILDNSRNSIIMDSLLGLKYKISNEDINYYEKKEEYYLNNNALSIGYLIKSNSDLDKSNPFEFQNTLLNSLAGTDHKYFKAYSFEKVKEEYIFKITNNEPIYIYYPFSLNKKCKIYINGNETLYQSEVFMYQKKQDEENISISIKCDNGVVNSEPSMYYLDYQKAIDAINGLKNGQLNIEKIENTYLRGTINVDEDKYILLLTVPYEEGLSLYVDGEEKQIIELFDTFVGVSLNKGNHVIELRYKTPGLLIGIIISIIGIMGTIVYLKKECILNKKMEIIENE